jgi:hypothetical protein
MVHSLALRACTDGHQEIVQLLVAEKGNVASVMFGGEYQESERERERERERECAHEREREKEERVREKESIYERENVDQKAK